jgi:hypothetical protein
MEPIGLHADHFHHLPAARDQFGQGLPISVGDWARFGTDAFSEQGDDLGIKRIGLGEPACGTGEIPDLARVDNGNRQSGPGQGSSYDDFEPAGRLEHNQRWSQNSQIVDQLLEGLAMAPDGKGLT